MAEILPIKLTLKQQRFVDFYEGNATEAAIKAGYSPKTAFTIGCENLKKPYIATELQNRITKIDAPKIATRQERQALWTEVLYDKSQAMSDRLRASELLGKSQADFLDRHEHLIKEFKFEEYKDKTDEQLINDLRELGIQCTT